MKEVGIWHAWKRLEIHTELRWENLTERVHYEELGVR
jgi:hypothetical protein